MPRKTQITEDIIIDAAIDLIRSRGIEAINARELAQKLHCSTQPIFSRFENMEDLRNVINEKASEIYNSAMRQGMNHANPFLGMGLAYIGFAKNETNLFKLLFMSDSFDKEGILQLFDGTENAEIIQMIVQMSGLKDENAKQLFMEIWLLTHGIASLIATNALKFTDRQIDTILQDSFNGFKTQLLNKQSGKAE